MSWISKIFGNKKSNKVKSDRTLAEAFHATNDSDYDDAFVKAWIKRKTTDVDKNIMVNPDLAFKEPTFKKLKELQAKTIQVSDEDYKDLTFDEEIDLNDYNLKDLTEETKQKIVELIKLDTEKRLGRRANTVFHDDGSWTTPEGITYTPEKSEENE